MVVVATVIPVVVVLVVTVVVIVVVAMMNVRGVVVTTVDMVIVVVVFVSVTGPAIGYCEEGRTCRRGSGVSSDSSGSGDIHVRAPGRFLRRSVGEQCRCARSLAAAGVMHVRSAFARIVTPAAHAMVVGACTSMNTFRVCVTWIVL